MLEKFYIIHAFMPQDLKLRGEELCVYALIYGFAKDGEPCTASLSYIANMTGLTRNGVVGIVNRLCSKGLIEKRAKEINGVRFVEYYTTKLDSVQESCTPPNKVVQCTTKSDGVYKKVVRGVQKSKPNNIVDNIEDNIQSIYTQVQDTDAQHTQVLATNPSKAEPVKTQTPRYDMGAELRSAGVPEDLIADYMQIRKARKAVNTENAYKGIKREADKAGITMTEAVRTMVEHSWQGFKAEWYERQQDSSKRNDEEESEAMKHLRERTYLKTWQCPDV